MGLRHGTGDIYYSMIVLWNDLYISRNGC